jgi:hypothetical protein
MARRARPQDAPDRPAGPSLSGHPRARRDIARAKGWGALAGFGAAAWLSHRTGMPPDHVALRALAAGAGTGLAAWGAAVLAWRQVALAQLRAARPAPPAGDPAAQGAGE